MEFGMDYFVMRVSSRVKFPRKFYESDKKIM